MEERILPDGRVAYKRNGKWVTPLSPERRKLLGKLRDIGKVMNFSALYGSGAKGLATFLQKEFPEKPFSELMEMSNRAILAKKGKKTNVFSGGTDSGAFNMMAEITLNQRVPTLPTLGTKITTALRPAVVGNDFIPGRMNWAIQATGAEILSITLVAMHWLCKEHEIPVRFVVSIHDEVWWLVPDRFKKQAAALFQMTHLYVWGLFNAQLGIPDLPLSNAFFSGVAVDNRVRKSVTECTVSPSNPLGLEEEVGVEYTISDLSESGVFKRLAARLKTYGGRL